MNLQPVHATTTLRHLLAVVLLALCSACAVSPNDVPRPVTTALPEGVATPLGDRAATLAAAHPGQSGFRLLTRGNPALTARHALALAARQTLDLQYYVVHDDESTRTLMRLVAQAAERGVRVRILVDDIHTGDNDTLIAAFAQRPNIDVRVFNPFGVRGSMGVLRTTEFLLNTDRLNRRMHNKAMIADNAAAIVGGRNLGDEYFGSRSATSFVDLDVLAVGPVVRQTSEGFDAYWNSPWAVPIEAFVRQAPVALPPVGNNVVPLPGATSLAASLLAGDLPLEWGEAEAWWDRPEKISGEAAAARDGVRIAPKIRALLLGAKEEVVLVSAYFVPRTLGAGQLSAMAQRGVRVKVMTNSLAATDVVAAHGGYAHYRTEMARGGVQLYELRPLEREPDAPPAEGSGPFKSRTSLHAKTMVVDGHTVVIGSSNADPRSVWLNTEMAIVIHSEALARSLTGQIDEVITARCNRVVWVDDHLEWERVEAGQTVRTDTEPDTTAWRRFLSNVLWTVAPEEFL